MDTQQIDWLLFLQMLPFMTFGVGVHVIGKFVVGRAQYKDEFQTSVFIKKNWMAWLLGFLYSLIGCYLYTRGVDPIKMVLENYNVSFPWDVVALLIGISLGSFSKTSIKLLLKINK